MALEIQDMFYGTSSTVYLPDPADPSLFYKQRCQLSHQLMIFLKKLQNVPMPNSIEIEEAETLA